MVLSTAEKEGCQRILYQLHLPDLASLYNTVIKTKPHNQVKSELIRRIIEESKTAEELLNRKKVYRNTIMQHLNNLHIFVFANSSKQEAIQKLLEYWGSSDSSVTVERNSAEKSSLSLQLQKTVSDTDVDQLSIQIASLSVNKKQEDSKKVDRADLDTQVQNDPDGKPPTKTRAKTASSSKTTPRKSKNVPCPAEQSVDSDAYTLLHISTPGAKPKGKTGSKTSLTTTVSVTISISEETPDKRPKAVKATWTEKQ